MYSLTFPLGVISLIRAIATLSCPLFPLGRFHPLKRSGEKGEGSENSQDTRLHGLKPGVPLQPPDSFNTYIDLVEFRVNFQQIVSYFLLTAKSSTNRFNSNPIRWFLLIIQPFRINQFFFIFGWKMSMSHVMWESRQSASSWYMTS